MNVFTVAIVIFHGGKLCFTIKQNKQIPRIIILIFVCKKKKEKEQRRRRMEKKNKKEKT